MKPPRANIYRDTWAGSVNRARIGEELRVAGWVHRRRDHGGLVFIEFVFSYPGAGLTLQQAALGNDYPLTQGLLLVFAFCVIAANFIMDLANFVLDPRVRTN